MLPKLLGYDKVMKRAFGKISQNSDEGVIEEYMYKIYGLWGYNGPKMPTGGRTNAGYSFWVESLKKRGTNIRIKGGLKSEATLFILRSFTYVQVPIQQCKNSPLHVKVLSRSK